MKRAAAYLRMSSDQQDKSPEDQLKEIEAKFEPQGYKIIRPYFDDAISGDEIRADFERMVTDAETLRDFETILVWSHDRFSRFDVLETAPYWARLRNAGVKLVSVAEGPMDFESIQGLILATVNQHAYHDFLKKLSFNVTRGHKSHAEQGKWSCARPPYGYRRDPVTEKLAIEPFEAETVEEIFRTYADTDVSHKTIAERLNAKGIKTRKGGPWKIKSILTILHNEAYVGTLIYGKRSTGKYTRVINGELTKVARGSAMVRQDRASRVVVQNAHKPIVSQELWDRVQAKLKERGDNKRKPRRQSFVLSGIARCGHCGTKLSGKANNGHRGYRCRCANDATRPVKPECRYLVNEWALLSRVVDDIQHRWLSDENLAACRKEFTHYLLGNRGKQAQSAKTLTTQIAALQTKIDRAEKRLADVDDDIFQALVSQIRAAKADQDKLRRELTVQSAVATASEKAVAEDAKKLEDYLRTLREWITSGDVALARSAILAFVDRVEVTTKPVSPPKPGARRIIDQVRIFYKPLTSMPDGRHSL